MSDNIGRDIAIAAGITIVFVASQLQASFNNGFLSFSPTYDDIVYYIDATHHVQSLWQDGIGAVLREYFAHPPATFLAAIGFLLFGIKPWAADAANALPLLLFVLIVLRLSRELPLGIRLIVTITILSIPIFSLAIVVFRPDMWCTGLTSLVCF